MISYIDLDKVPAFEKLKKLKKPELKKLISADMVKKYITPAGKDLDFSYAGEGITDEFLSLLQELADSQQCIEKYREILRCAVMNPGEKRMVLHHFCRGISGFPSDGGGEKYAAFYEEQKRAFFEFSDRVRDGEIRSCANKKFDTVVQIGIGGSSLGPKALCRALEGYVSSDPDHLVLKTGFISNVDPDAAAGVLEKIDPDTALFILVTKSGTTQETLTNYELIKDIVRKRAPSVKLERQTAVVTGKNSPLASCSEFLASFFIDDYVGGRFSSSGACGGVLISLAFGKEIFQRFLDGCHFSDLLALNRRITENAPLLDALLGVYDTNIRGIRENAVIPYSDALSLFPAHLQQLFMESNGKRVNRRSEDICYSTSPVIFGSSGTDSQHSFFQQLHQGTSAVSLQFIGFSGSQRKKDFIYKGSSSCRKLDANLAAQMTAFALGRSDADPNKHFPGNRTSSLLYGKELVPENAGALFSHFENKAMFQGFLWNINSFDQEGVQLGKALADQALRYCEDPLLEAYFSLLC